MRALSLWPSGLGFEEFAADASDGVFVKWAWLPSVFGNELGRIV